MKQQPRLAGLLAFEDPPRADSKHFIDVLGGLGVRTVMVTDGSAITAVFVAVQLGIATTLYKSIRSSSGEPEHLLDCDVFADMYLEDKFELVRAMQRHGHITGMTRNGVNDAPALKQAEVGIAVANGTDVARAAASLVLANDGLGDIVSAGKVCRRIYQRTLTYTLNMIVKTIEITVLLSTGVIITGNLVATPTLILFLRCVSESEHCIPLLADGCCSVQ